MKNKKSSLRNKLMVGAALGMGITMLAPGMSSFAETTQAHNMVKHAVNYAANQSSTKYIFKQGTIEFKGGPFTYVTSAPNWNNDGVGKLYNGDYVTIVGEQGNWYQIQSNNVNFGWVCKDRVANVSNVKYLNKMATVDFKGGPFTYVTSAPNWNNDGIGKLYNGDQVNIISEYGNWYQIALKNGNEAWICKDRVSSVLTVKNINSSEAIVSFKGGPFTYITSQPNWDNDGIGKLYNGTVVSIIAECGNWYQIMYGNGEMAWICKDRVTKFQSSTILNKKGVVDFKGGPFTYITSSPNWNNDGIGKLYNGTTVNIIGEYGDWYQISLNNERIAWICKDRISSVLTVKNFNAEGIVSFKGGPFTYVTSQPNWNNDGITKLYNGNLVFITGECNGWYQISLDNENQMWIPKDRVSLSKLGVVDCANNSTANIYPEPNSYSSVNISLDNGAQVNIVGQKGNWYEIIYQNGNSNIMWINKNDVIMNNKVEKLSKVGTVNFEGGPFSYVTRQPNWNNDGAGKVNNGTQVSIIGESNGWYNIMLNGNSVWIPKARVMLSNSVKALNEKGTLEFKDGHAAALYNMPNSSAKVVEVVPNNSKLEITGEYGNWYKISFGNKTGWVLKDNVITSNSKENKVKPEVKKAETTQSTKQEVKKAEKAQSTKPEVKKAETTQSTKPEAKKAETTQNTKQEAKKAEKAQSTKSEVKKAETTQNTKQEVRKAEKAQSTKLETKKVEENKVQEAKYNQEVSNQVENLINQYRKENGLQAITSTTKTNESAMTLGNNLAKNIIAKQDNMEMEAKTSTKDVKGVAQSIFNQLKNSESNRQEMLGKDLKHMSVAVYEGSNGEYYTGVQFSKEVVQKESVNKENASLKTADQTHKNVKETKQVDSNNTTTETSK